jgi:hypothetical protein
MKEGANEQRKHNPWTAPILMLLLLPVLYALSSGPALKLMVYLHRHGHVSRETRDAVANLYFATLGPCLPNHSTVEAMVHLYLTELWGIDDWGVTPTRPWPSQGPW